MFNFESNEPNLHFDGVTDLDPREVAKNMKLLALIDVRQAEEFTGELGHIPSATLIVLDTLPENISKIPQDKPVVFVCRSGGRSARAASFARASGLKNIYNLKGGMILWNELHLPTEA